MYLRIVEPAFFNELNVVDAYRTPPFGPIMETVSAAVASHLKQPLALVILL